MAANHCKDLESNSSQFLKPEPSDFNKNDIQQICKRFQEKSCISIDLVTRQYDDKYLSQVVQNQSDKNQVILITELTYL